jgi:hypothetical protein
MTKVESSNNGVDLQVPEPNHNTEKEGEKERLEEFFEASKATHVSQFKEWEANHRFLSIPIRFSKECTDDIAKQWKIHFNKKGVHVTTID